jgi:WD40 repeat protein
VAISADGNTLVTASLDQTARLWDVPPPAADEQERLWLSIEVQTWHTFERENCLIPSLAHDEWRARKAKLDSLGRSCDVRSWQDLSPAERAQLRQPPRIPRAP